MKISTLRTLSNLTTDAAILEELNTEIAKAEKVEARKAEEKAAAAAVYAAAHDIVMGALAEATAPVTVAELYANCDKELPEGFSKNKLAYALRALWANEVVKTEGKVNTYAVKA